MLEKQLAGLHLARQLTYASTSQMNVEINRAQRTIMGNDFLHFA